MFGQEFSCITHLTALVGMQDALIFLDRAVPELR